MVHDDAGLPKTVRAYGLVLSHDQPGSIQGELLVFCPLCALNATQAGQARAGAPISETMAEARLRMNDKAQRQVCLEIYEAGICMNCEERF